MQCPSCGFENIPGNQSCCVCSTPLEAEREKGKHSPPRAKDRTLWQRIAWTISTRPTVLRISERLYDLTRQPISAFSIVDIGLVLLSAIPGFSHCCILRKPLAALFIAVGSATALALAVLIYKTSISDLLVWSVICTSVYCMSVAINHIRGDIRQDMAGYLNRAGVMLMVFCTYLSIYLMLRLALGGVVTIVHVNTVPYVSPISAGDNILIRRIHHLSRGDLVLVYVEHGATVGPILGFPGDHVRVDDMEHVYINNRRYALQTNLPHELDIPETPPGMVTLEKGQYWVQINATVPPDEQFLQNVAESGVVNTESVWGRAIAVVGPPAHRRLIDRQIEERH